MYKHRGAPHSPPYFYDLSGSPKYMCAKFNADWSKSAVVALISPPPPLYSYDLSESPKNICVKFGADYSKSAAVPPAPSICPPLSAPPHTLTTCLIAQRIYMQNLVPILQKL